jgi:phosphoserine phosphatase
VPEAAPARLGSWSEGTVKQRILAFVDEVTDPSRDTYVRPAERIAVFDLDGTLIVESPLYLEVLVAGEKLRAVAIAEPALAELEPYKWLVTEDYDAIREHGSEIVIAAAAQDSLEQFAQDVRSILSTGVHPTLGRPYSALFYAPMLELMELLRMNDFRVYVVSQSQQEYIRAFAAPCLGAEPPFVIGSMIAFHQEEGSFVRTAAFWEPHNSREGKVLRIRERAGGAPILAFGNSMGDRQVLEATERAPTSLALVLDHDDGVRELEYHHDALLELARERRWEVVSMKRDFVNMFRENCLATAAP